MAVMSQIYDINVMSFIRRRLREFSLLGLRNNMLKLLELVTDLSYIDFSLLVDDPESLQLGYFSPLRTLFGDSIDESGEFIV